MSFLEHAPDRQRAAEWLARVEGWLREPGVIAMDPQAEGYVHKVLDWAPVPDSYYAKFADEDTLRAHLDALLAEQLEDGGWPIRWPALSAAAESEWRGWITVQRLRTLRAYGRL